MSTLPTDAKARKDLPLATGVLDYFPAALAAVAEVSRVGNDQHNPGEAVHWARGKSMDQADCAVRHIMERGGIDTDGLRHTAKAAWRVLAMLQLELEAAGGPMARGATPSPEQHYWSGASGGTKWCGVCGNCSRPQLNHYFPSMRCPPPLEQSELQEKRNDD